METLTVGTQGVKGGVYREKKVGYITVNTGMEKIISVDNYKGAADNYMQRPEPIICIIGIDRNDCIFEGTHKQLIEKLSKV